MPLQSIRRTPLSGTHPEVDYRTYQEVWPELRLNMDLAEPHMAGIAGAITVAVVDSGFPAGTAGINAQNRDDDGHATLLEGTIQGPAGRRYSSVNIDLRPVKAFSAQGWPSPDSCADAITRAAALNPKVIVLAWDVGHTTPLLEAAIKAVENTAVVVIAAGNWSLDNDLHHNWPANYSRVSATASPMEHVITVMATDEHDERASYSSWGWNSVYIAAPGFAKVDTPPSSSPLRNGGSLRGGYCAFRGTSAATAHVALLAALVRAKHPTWNPKAVKDHIGAKKRGGVPALTELCKTGGVVDFEAALR